MGSGVSSTPIKPRGGGEKKLPSPVNLLGFRRCLHLWFVHEPFAPRSSCPSVKAAVGAFIYGLFMSRSAIRFASADTSLGGVLVAASDGGVCAILFGDDPSSLQRELERRFPDTDFFEDRCELEGALTAVVSLVEAPGSPANFSLDLRGTDFQRRVWDALAEIPAGETATYSHIAGRIGAPNARRAVARACGANPLAVAIPCHRVVRTDGGLGGYRWGLERKRALLAREQVH